jgi:hypothetical protein
MAVDGLQGNFQAQPRVFGHSAVALTGSAARIANTEGRGCCLYIGTGGDIEVILEGNTTSVTFKNVPSGHFLPVLATHYVQGGGDILAIF